MRRPPPPPLDVASPTPAQPPGYIPVPPGIRAVYTAPEVLFGDGNPKRSTRLRRFRWPILLTPAAMSLLAQMDSRAWLVALLENRPGIIPIAWNISLR